MYLLCQAIFIKSFIKAKIDYCEQDDQHMWPDAKKDESFSEANLMSLNVLVFNTDISW